MKNIVPNMIIRIAFNTILLLSFANFAPAQENRAIITPIPLAKESLYEKELQQLLMDYQNNAQLDLKKRIDNLSVIFLQTHPVPAWYTQEKQKEIYALGEIAKFYKNNKTASSQELAKKLQDIINTWYDTFNKSNPNVAK